MDNKKINSTTNLHRIDKLKKNNNDSCHSGIRNRKNTYSDFNSSKINLDIMENSNDVNKENYNKENTHIRNYLKSIMSKYNFKNNKDKPNVQSKKNRRKTMFHNSDFNKFDENNNSDELSNIKRNSYNNFSYKLDSGRLKSKKNENNEKKIIRNNLTNLLNNDNFSDLNNLRLRNEYRASAPAKVLLDNSRDSIISRKTDLDNSKRDLKVKNVKFNIEENNSKRESVLKKSLAEKDKSFNSNYNINFENFDNIDKNNANIEERPLFKFNNIRESLSNSEEEEMKNYKDEAFIPSPILVYPDSNFKKFWDYFILIFIVYSITVAPVRIAFNYQDDLWSNYFMIDFFLDLVFVFDILINFFVPFYDREENQILSFKHIAFNYVTSWFPMDIVSSFPISFIEIYNYHSNESNRKSSAQFNRSLRLLRIIKWFRVMRLIKVAKHYNNQIRPDTNNLISKFVYDQGVYSRLFKSGLIFVFLIHISSCLWIYIGQSNDNYLNSWIKSCELDEISDIEVYIASIYFSLTTVYSIGYGDILATNFLERFYTCIFMMVGVMVFSFAISSLSTMFLKTDKNTKDYENSISVLDEMKYEYQINNEFYEKIKNSLKYRYTRNYSDRYALLSSLPRNLKNEIIIILHEQQIKDLNFFFQKPYDFILYLLPLLISMKLFKGELLFCLGEFVEEMYLCVNGCLSLHLGYMFHNIEVAQIRKNNNFGDILMYSNEQSPFDLKVKSKICELLVLKKLEYSKLKMKFPDIVIKELKKSLEAYKFLMERRRLFIEAITSADSSDMEVIMKAIKKVRYQTYDKATLNLISITHKKERNAEYLKKLSNNNLINMVAKHKTDTALNYHNKDHVGKIEDMEKGLEEEIKINNDIKQEKSKNLIDMTHNSEKNVFLTSQNNSFKANQISPNNKYKSLKSPGLNPRRSHSCSAKNINKISNTNKKNSIQQNIAKKHSKIKINYYHIENNVDKYFYLNENERNDRDNFVGEKGGFIEKLNERTTKRLKTLLKKKTYNRMKRKKSRKSIISFRRPTHSFKKIGNFRSNKNESVIGNNLEISKQTKDLKSTCYFSQDLNQSDLKANLIQNYNEDNKSKLISPDKSSSSSDSQEMEKKIIINNNPDEDKLKNLNNKLDNILKLMNTEEDDSD